MRPSKTHSLALISLCALSAACSGSRKPSSPAPAAAVSPGVTDQEAFVAAAAEAQRDPDALVGWAEVQRSADQDGQEQVVLVTDEGQSLAVENPAALGATPDGEALRFVGRATQPGRVLVSEAQAGGPLRLASSSQDASSQDEDGDEDGDEAKAALALRSSLTTAANTPSTPPKAAALVKAAALPATSASATLPASSAASATLPAASAASATPAPAPWALRHGMSSAGYQEQVNLLAAQGYRVVSIGAKGSASSPRFTAIWVKDGKPWSARHGMSSGQLQSEVQARAAEGFRPVTVAQHGTWPNERYAAAFVKDGLAWRMRHRLSSRAYQDAFEAQSADGYRPLWVTSTGLLGSERYAAIWIKDGRAVRARHRLTKRELEDALYADDREGWRPFCLSEHGTPGAYRYAALWIRDAAPGASTNLVWHRQRPASYQAIANHLAGDGFRPTCVIQVGRASSPRYSHCWRRDPGAWVFRRAGFAGAGLGALDQAMEGYMRDRRVTHATLCVAKDGQVVLSRGYTFAPASARRTQPTSRLRIASISKPMTAIAILRLVDQGRLSLDDTVGELLPGLSSLPRDRRFRSVTVRQLLQHRGGWAISAREDDNGVQLHGGLGFDPMFNDSAVAQAFLKPMPVSPRDVIRYMARRQRLQFQPGAFYSYSNFGYNLLGRILERVTGRDYEAHLRQDVFQRVSANSFRVGHAQLHRRLPGEVHYHDVEGGFARDKHGTGELLPVQYGGWNLHNMDSHGGWIASARDLVRVTLALQQGRLLRRATRDAMWTKQAPDRNYGLGWGLSGGTLPNHNGSLTGTWTWLRTRPQGVVYAVLTNQRSSSLERFDYSATGQSLSRRLDDALSSVYGN